MQLNHREINNELRKMMGSALQKERCNGRRTPWRPGMALRLNSNGQPDQSSLGYNFLMDALTFIRPIVLAQKYYEVSVADYVPISKSEVGGWEDNIVTMATGAISGTFSEQSGTSVASGPTAIDNIDVAIGQFNARVRQWRGGFGYDIVEVNQALAGLNFDIITARMLALRKRWQLGIQDTAFLGLDTDLTNFPGLLTNPNVAINTALIPQAISTMSASQFQAFVGGLLGVFANTAFFTETPDTLLVPYEDYVGLPTATASGFPINMMITYMLTAFRKASGKPWFRILPCRYGDAARNAGFITSTGVQRYVLYNSAIHQDRMSVHMDIPIDFTLNPAMSWNGYNWQGVAFGRYTGAWVYRTPECLYLDIP